MSACLHLKIAELFIYLHSLGVVLLIPSFLQWGEFSLQHEKFSVSAITNQRYLYLFAYLCILTKVFLHFEKSFDISEWKLVIHYFLIFVSPEMKHRLNLLFPCLGQSFIAPLAA